MEMVPEAVEVIDDGGFRDAGAGEDDYVWKGKRDSVLDFCIQGGWDVRLLEGGQGVGGKGGAAGQEGKQDEEYGCFHTFFTEAGGR